MSIEGKEYEVVHEVEVNEEEIEEVKGFAKMKNFAKTKGKKIAAIAAVGGAAVGGFVLAKVLSKHDDSIVDTTWEPAVVFERVDEETTEE